VYDFVCLPVRGQGEQHRFFSSGRIKYRTEKMVVSALTMQGVVWEWETRLFRCRDGARMIAARPDIWIPSLQIALEIKEAEPQYWSGREFATRQEELVIRCGFGFAYVVTGKPAVAALRAPEFWNETVVQAMDVARSCAAEAKAHHPEWRTLRRMIKVERTHVVVLSRKPEGRR